MENILVSISCITYNHEKFIADAIDSFLMQKTNFNFEILIHDDASTDRTADIVREYEGKYPHLIKPVYQIENQYSKGGSGNKINFNRARGKYIALCEGDDYWTDPYKLQKQVDYMENHPECGLCVHGGYVVSAAEKKITMYNRPAIGNKIFTVSEVIEGGGALFLTNSMLFPTEFGKNRPAFLENAPVGDYPKVINLSLLGTVYCIDEYMSAYRIGDDGSWTTKNFSNIEKKKKHYAEIAHMLEEINEYTERKYDDVIKRTMNRTQLFLLLEQGNFKEAKKGAYKELYQELGLKMKVTLFMDKYSPGFLKALRLTKRKLV